MLKKAGFLVWFSSGDRIRGFCPSILLTLSWRISGSLKYDSPTRNVRATHMQTRTYVDVFVGSEI